MELPSPSKSTSQMPVRDDSDVSAYGAGQSLQSVLNNPNLGKDGIYGSENILLSWMNQRPLDVATEGPPPLPPEYEDITRSEFLPYVNRISEAYQKFVDIREHQNLSYSQPDSNHDHDTQAREASGVTEGSKPGDGLDDVPSIYFDDRFALERREIFELACPSTTIPANILLQEKLSHYLDTVEVQLVREISSRSTSFFEALEMLEDLNRGIVETCDRIRSVRTVVDALDSDLLESSRFICRARTCRGNLLALHHKLKLVAYVQQALTTLKLLLAAADFSSALDVIVELRKLMWDGELSGMHCFRRLGEQLSGATEAVNSILQKEFVLEAVHSRVDLDRAAIAEGLRARHKEGLTAAVQGLESMESAGESERQQDIRERLLPLVVGLLRTSRLPVALRVYHDSLTTDIKAAVKTVTADMLHRLSANTTTTSSSSSSTGGDGRSGIGSAGAVEQAAAISAADVDPVDVDGTPSLSLKLRALPPASFLQLLLAVFAVVQTRLVRAVSVRCVMGSIVKGECASSTGSTAGGAGGGGGVSSSGSSSSSSSSSERGSIIDNSCVHQGTGPNTKDVGPTLTATDPIIPSGHDMHGGFSANHTSEESGATFTPADIEAAFTAGAVLASGTAVGAGAGAGGGAKGSARMATSAHGEGSLWVGMRTGPAAAIGSVAAGSIAGYGALAAQQTSSASSSSRSSGINSDSSSVADAATAAAVKQTKLDVLKENAEVVSDACDVAHGRWAKLLTVRAPQHAILSLQEFVDLHSLTSHFITCTERMGGRLGYSIRGTLQSQCKAFVEAHHADKMQRVMAVLDKESWSAIDPPPSLQLLVDFFEAHTAAVPVVTPAAATTATATLVAGTTAGAVIGAVATSGKQGGAGDQEEKQGAAQANGDVSHERKEGGERSGSEKDGERMESVGEGRDGGANEQVGGSVPSVSVREGAESGRKVDDSDARGEVQDEDTREKGRTRDRGDVKAGEGEKGGAGGGGAREGGVTAVDSPSGGSKMPKKSSVGTVLCHGSKYHVAGCSVALLSSIREYVAISDALPGMAAEVVQRLCDLLRLFNSRTCQLVLGAGAMQVSGLKSITAKHLALSSQCVSLVFALIADFRRILSAHLPDARRLLVTSHLDRVAQDYRVHRDEIHSKLVAIMRERLLTHLKALPAVAEAYNRGAQQAATAIASPAPGAAAASGGGPADAGTTSNHANDSSSSSSSSADVEPSNFAKALTKEVGVLHRILSPLLLESDLRSIFSRVVALFHLQLADSFGKLELPSPLAKRRMLADILLILSSMRALPCNPTPEGRNRELEAFVASRFGAQALSS